MPFDSATYPETTAQKMLAFFGTNGENWCGHSFTTPGRKACLMGAFAYVVSGEWPRGHRLSIEMQMHPAFSRLAKSALLHGTRNIARLNDDAFDDRNFEKIRSVLRAMHELEVKEMVNAA
jgi:hypothetical protein